MKDDAATIPFDEIANMLQERDNYGVGKVHPTKRSLSIIASRCNIMQQNIPESISGIPNILDIPEGITLSCGLSNSSKERQNKVVANEEQHSQQETNVQDCYMINEILNDIILQGLPMATITSEAALQTQTGVNVEKLSFQHIISKYNLDFKQSVAFEIMSCSFILKSLEVQNITEETLQQFFGENENIQKKYTNCLKGFKKSMKDKGGEDQLIMFLSGMGGTGKSEVIKAFVEFAKGISIFFDWNYDSNVIKVSAYTGAAACQIPNGRTLHSTVGLCGYTQ